jgi:uncharacterized glyoxalase superfamily protein PhnB
MVQNPPEGQSRVTPYISYEDGDAALEFLSRAFGFKERLRYTNDDGSLGHAEMVIGDDGVIMLGTPPDYQSPKKTGARSMMVHVYVDDIDAHHENAKREGAEVEDIKDQEYGDRNYHALDLEGQSWYFSQHMRDVDPSEWGAQG